MIHIERIRMHLPAGFEHRATSIARLVGTVLAKQSVSQDVLLNSLSVSPPRLPLNISDAEIANQIVEQIVSAYRGRQ